MIETPGGPWRYLHGEDHFARWCGVADIDQLDVMTWEGLENLPAIKAKTLYIGGPSLHVGQKKITWFVAENRPDFALLKTLTDGGDRFIGIGDTVNEAALLGLLTAWEMTSLRLQPRQPTPRSP